MGHPVGPATGGEPYDRARPDASAQLGDPVELADSPEGRRIEQKLRAEALARRGAEDGETDIDPSGHA